MFPRGSRRASYHQLLSHDTLGETGEVLNIGGGGQLAASGDAIGHEALIEDGCRIECQS
jgi:hypothetical protein